MLGDNENSRPKRDQKAPMLWPGHVSWAEVSDDAIEHDNIAKADNNEQPDEAPDSTDEEYVQEGKVTTASADLPPRDPRPEYMNTRERLAAIRELNKEISEQKDKLKHLRKTRTEANKQLKIEKKQRKILKADLKNRKEEVKLLNKQLRHARDDYEQRRQRFTEAERDFFAKIEKQNYPSFPDNVIAVKFKELSNACRDWIKDWSHEAPTVLEEQLLDQCMSENARAIHAVLVRKFQKEVPKMNRMLGYGNLVTRIMHLFFADPFFAFPTTSKASLQAVHSAFELGKCKLLIYQCKLTQQMMVEKHAHGVLRLSDCKNATSVSDLLLCNSMLHLRLIFGASARITQA